MKLSAKTPGRTRGGGGGGRGGDAKTRNVDTACRGSFWVVPFLGGASSLFRCFLSLCQLEISMRG